MSNASVTVSGNLTSDPELKYTANGSARLGFSVASNRRYQTANGEWTEETSFFNVVAWRTVGENAANVLEKGMPVMVSGRLEQRTWEDNDGNKRSTVEIVADKIAVDTWGIESLVRRRGGSGNTQAAQNDRPAFQRPQRAMPADDPFGDF